MVASAEKSPTLHNVLNVPEDWVPARCQLVGYPVEEEEASGQRPRFPFETLYFAGVYGKPYARDSKIVEELKHLSRMLGFPLYIGVFILKRLFR